MRHRHVFLQQGLGILVLALGAAAMPLPSMGQAAPLKSHQFFDEGSKKNVPVVSGEILVTFKPGLAEAEIARTNRANRGKEKRKIDRINTRVIKLGKGQAIEKALESYRRNPNVILAEPNFIAQASIIPNDTLFSSQWGLQQIRCPEAWDTEKGSPDVIIAILDTGIDLTHADLAGKLVPGYDFVNGDNDPDDDYFHGTWVAGIAAAATDNGLGIAGTAWGSKLMPVKVLDSDGWGSYADVASGIIYAADHGAHVINMSLSGPSRSATLEAALAHAHASGCVIVSAAGNYDSPLPQYPAAYPESISVAATDEDDQRATFSNYGTTIELSAPGVNILGTYYIGNRYVSTEGTSASAPFVSGVAALVISGDPDLTNEQVREVLRSSAVDLGTPGWDQYFGYGRIDAAAAVGWSEPAGPGASDNGLLAEEWHYDMQWYDWGYFGSSPGVVDLGSDVNTVSGEPDSDLEIVTGSDEFDLPFPDGSGKTALGLWYCFDSQGGMEWFTDTESDESRGSVAIADIDEDGSPDIVGSTTSGETVEAMDRFGEFIWTFPTPPRSGNFMWPAAPAVADADPDNSGLEVIVSNRPHGMIYAFDGDNSDMTDDGYTWLGGWPWEGVEGVDWDILWVYEIAGGWEEVYASTAVADVDADGVLEVVVGTIYGTLVIVNARTGALEASVSLDGGIYASAALADLDGNGLLDIIVGTMNGIVHCKEWNGLALTDRWEHATGGPVYSSASVGDVDGDGEPEVVVGANDGNVYCLDASGAVEWVAATGGAVYSSPSLARREGFCPGSNEWPMFRGDPGRTGRYSGGTGFPLGVYVGSEDEYFYLIDGSTGNTIDRFRVRRSTRYSGLRGVHTSAAVADVDYDSKLEVFFTDWGNTSTKNGHTFWAVEDVSSIGGDVDPPVISLAGEPEVHLECQEEYTDAGATAIDNCDGDITDQIAVDDPVDTDSLGTYLVRYNVSDSAGNAAEEVSRTVIVEDGVPPAITCPEDIAVACADNGRRGTSASDAAIREFLAGVAATDSCREVEITDDAPALFPEGETIVTFTAADAADNTATCRAVVTVDRCNRPPVAACVDAAVDAGPGCVAGASVDGGSYDPDGDELTLVQVPPGPYGLGATAVTLAVSDGEFWDSCGAVVTVSDWDAPLISLLGEQAVRVECSSGYEDAGALAADECDGDLSSQVMTDNPVDDKAPGDYAVTYNVFDSAGNAAVEVSRTVTVEDTVPPVITCPAGVSVESESGLCSARVDLQADATDACDPDVTVIGDSPGTFEVGRTVVTFVAQDGSGNGASCAMTVEVSDVEPPVMTCPADIIAGTDPGQCRGKVELPPADAGDNCAVASVTSDAPANGVFPLGQTGVTFTATDVNGNETMCSMKVTVLDAEPPAVTLRGAAAEEVECHAAYSDAGAAAADNCDGDLTASITVSGSVDVEDPGSYTLSYSVKDRAGNAANEPERAVSVKDTTAPVITLAVKQGQVVECGVRGYETGAELFEECDENAGIVMADGVDMGVLGEHTVTYDATDASGNAAVQVVQRVTVADTMVPRLEITYPDDGACLSAGAVTVGYEASDRCDAKLEVVFQPGDGTYTLEGDYTVTVTATDASGNSIGGVVHFSIDRTAPVVDVTSPVEVLYPDGRYPYTDYCYAADMPIPVLFTSNGDADAASGGIVREAVLVDGVVLYAAGGVGDAGGTLSGGRYDENGVPQLVLDGEVLCDIGVNILGVHTLRVEAEDCAENVGSAEVQFEVVLCMDDGYVVVKPESLKQNSGVMTVFMWLPGICEGDLDYSVADVFAASLELTALPTGARAYALRVDAAEDKLVIKFHRDHFPEPIGNQFMLMGTLEDETGPVFVGYDDVMKNPPDDYSGEEPEPASPKGSDSADTAGKGKGKK